ncbi:MAG: DUF1015 domain-containing protein [Eubacteriales bacterium]
MNHTIFQSTNILIPKATINKTKWSVVACDQYTSERSYWKDLSTTIGAESSTLNMIFPEVYLEDEDFQERIQQIGRNMYAALEADIFHTYEDSYIYVKRTLANGQVRHGIVGMIDLEAYDYTPCSHTPIRATEGTILERIPPRVQIRNHCPLEVPHIMLLIDDASKTIIESIAQKAHQLSQVYDFDLLKNSGHISGYLLDEACITQLQEGIQQLRKQSSSHRQSGCNDQDMLLFAVGDGNHSLATAKKCYENLKEKVGQEALNHPARYALVEVVNLHDDSLEFEAIHRVIFQINPSHLYKKLCAQFQVNPSDTLEENDFVLVMNDQTYGFTRKDKIANIALGDLQLFLDDYLSTNGGSIDYIHGADVVHQLCIESQTSVGFLLNPMEKSQLFETVMLDGALPRKTFSMGEACDKRFYLEARKIL